MLNFRMSSYLSVTPQVRGRQSEEKQPPAGYSPAPRIQLVKILRFKELGFSPPQAAAYLCGTFNSESSEVTAASTGSARDVGKIRTGVCQVSVLRCILGQETKVNRKCAGGS